MTKFLFIAMDDDQRAHLTYCADEADVLEAVGRAVFDYPDRATWSAEHVEEAVGIQDTLLEDGVMRFEGDAPLYLFRLADGVPASDVLRAVSCRTCRHDAARGPDNPRCAGCTVVLGDGDGRACLWEPAGVPVAPAPSLPDCVFREIDLTLKALAELKPMTAYGVVGTRDVDQARRRTALLRAESSLEYLRKLLSAHGVSPIDIRASDGEKK